MKYKKKVSNNVKQCENVLAIQYQYGESQKIIDFANFDGMEMAWIDDLEDGNIIVRVDDRQISVFTGMWVLRDQATKRIYVCTDAFFNDTYSDVSDGI